MVVRAPPNEPSSSRPAMSAIRRFPPSAGGHLRPFASPPHGSQPLDFERRRMTVDCSRPVRPRLKRRRSLDAQIALRACPTGSNRRGLQSRDRNKRVPDQGVPKQGCYWGAAPDSTMGIWPNFAADVWLSRPISGRMLRSDEQGEQSAQSDRPYAPSLRRDGPVRLELVRAPPTYGDPLLAARALHLIAGRQRVRRAVSPRRPQVRQLRAVPPAHVVV